MSVAISRIASPAGEGASGKTPPSHRPKRGPGVAGDSLLRRFVLTVTREGSETEEIGRYRTKAEAAAAFEAFDKEGTKGLVRSLSGPRIAIELPVDPNRPQPPKPPASKRPRGPIVAPRVSQAEVGAEIMVTAWGETKTLYEWSGDPRAKASYQTIRSRLSRAKLWMPERAIATPPSDNALRSYNIENAPKYEAFGESKSVTEWLADSRCDTSPNSFRKKLKQGVPTYLALQKRTPSHWRKTGKDYEAFGERKSLGQWAEDPRCKASYHILKTRMEEGVTLERAMNEHDPRSLEAFGERKNLTQWAEDDRCVVSRQTLNNRLEAGVSLERAITELRIERRPHPKASPLGAFDESKSLSEWARDPRCVVTRQTLAQRLEDGVSLEEAITARSIGRKVAQYEAFGEGKSISKWLKDPRCHASYPTIRVRLEAGVPFENAIGKLVSIRANHEMEGFGEKKTVGEWANDERCAVSWAVLVMRLRAGMPLEWAMQEHERLNREKLDVSRFMAATARALASVVEAKEDSKIDEGLREIERLVSAARSTLRRTG